MKASRSFLSQVESCAFIISGSTVAFNRWFPALLRTQTPSVSMAWSRILTSLTHQVLVTCDPLWLDERIVYHIEARQSNLLCCLTAPLLDALPCWTELLQSSSCVLWPPISQCQETHRRCRTSLKKNLRLLFMTFAIRPDVAWWLAVAQLGQNQVEFA